MRRGTLAASTALAGAVLASSNPALAGTCLTVAGAYECSGASDVAVDTAQQLTLTPPILSAETLAGFGIDTSSNPGSDAIAITGSGTFTDANQSSIVGGRTGIGGYNSENGDLTISTSGFVRGTGSDGIAVDSQLRYGYYYNEYYGYGYSYVTGGGGNVTIHANTVTGASRGIAVNQNGYGSTTVTATGLVEGTTGRGIDLSTSNSGGATTVDANAVTGGSGGIRVNSSGYGPISVAAHGTVTGQEGDGISVYGSRNTGDLTITTDAAVSGRTGIFARSRGFGNVSVTAAGQVTGTYGDGIDVYGESGTGDLTVSAADVSGYYYGVRVGHYGRGALTVTTTGSVSGTYGSGIDVRGGSGTSSITINSADVTGYHAGIRAYNQGTGALTITASGPVTATGSGKGQRGGIVAFNRGGYLSPTVATFASLVPISYSAPTDLTIVAGSVTSATTGITATNYGTGSTSITTTGPVVGDNGDGIVATGGNYSGDLTVSTAAVSGSDSGIDVRHYGTGAVSVTATGAVTGTNYGGIYVFGAGGTSSITINAAAVTGGYAGIHAVNRGTGALAITASGLVETTVVAGERVNAGIYAQNQAGIVLADIPYGVSAAISGPTDLIINAVNVDGAGHGIFATNAGSGITSITATGTVTGAAFDGIHAEARPTSSGLVINAAKVSGYTHGIYASNEGPGALTITASGDVTATGSAAEYIDGSTGITAYNGRRDSYGYYYGRSRRAPAGTNLTISARNVSGSDIGIRAENLGTGKTSVTASGTVVGTNGAGIVVYNGYDSTDLTITANGVTGGQIGVVAYSRGSGKTSINVSGPVQGGNSGGIRAATSYSSTGLQITTAAVSASRRSGIAAYHGGTGDLAVTASGPVSVADGNGIVAYSGQHASGLTISATDVSAAATRPTYRYLGTVGIGAINGGPGALAITATGTVSATDAVAVNDPAYSEYGLSPRSVGIYAVNGRPYRSERSLSLVYYGGTATGTDLTITAKNVSGDLSGIVAHNLGTGATSVTSTGTVTGGTAEGILVVNVADATGALSVVANAVSGGTDAIRTENFGAGALAITANGTVAGQNGLGISASNAGGGTTSITVNARGKVTGTQGGVGVSSINPVTITNAGSISNASGLATDVAITVLGITPNPVMTLATVVTPVPVSTTLANTGGITGIVNLAPGANVVRLAGGSMTGTINMGDAGANTLTFTGGATTGTINMGDGGGNALTFTGGTLSGGINLGEGNNNSATLRGLTAANFAGPSHVSSGSGLNNTLTLDHVAYKGGSFATDSAALGLNLGFGYTAISLINGTNFTLTGPLVFAHSTLSVGAGSTLTVAPGGQTISSTGGAATVLNAGTIDLIGAGSTATNSLTIKGNYTGTSGTLLVGTNGVRSDLLIIDGANGGGLANGTTIVVVSDLSTLGAGTSGDGIKVVDAVNGAVIAPGSFRLGAPIQAGARDYALLQGGVADPSNPDFFLRASGFRPEVYVDAIIPAMAHQIGQSLMGVLDDRLEASYRGSGRGGLFWGRSFGEKGSVRQDGARLSGTGYNYSNGGMIVGIDVVGNGTQSGSRDLLGPYFGYGRITADLRQGVVGHDRLDAFVLGGYWTHFGASGWYTNLQAQLISVTGSAKAATGTRLAADGKGYAISFEAGAPLALSDGLKLIPQVQVQWQDIDFNRRRDPVAIIDHRDGGALTARAGLKLEQSSQASSAGSATKYWLRTDVVSGFNADSITDVSTLAGTNTASFRQNTGNTWARVGGGLAVAVSAKATVFASANYNQQLDHAGGKSVSGVIGLNIAW